MTQNTQEQKNILIVLQINESSFKWPVSKVLNWFIDIELQFVFIFCNIVNYKQSIKHEQFFSLSDNFFLLLILVIERCNYIALHNTYIQHRNTLRRFLIPSACLYQFSRLRARPKHLLSSGTKLPCESALYLAWLGFFLS